MASLYTAKIASIFVMRDILVKTPSDLMKYGYDLNTYSWIHVNRIFEVKWLFHCLNYTSCFNNKKCKIPFLGSR